MKCFHDMVYHVHQKRILSPWNQYEAAYLHRWLNIWNSRTSGASRQQNKFKGTPAWTKAISSSSGRSNWKKYRSDEAWIYRCVEHAILVGEDSAQQKCSFKAHPYDQRRCCQADDASRVLFIFTRSVSRKNWNVYFHDRGWRRLRYLPTKLLNSRTDKCLQVGGKINYPFPNFNGVIVGMEKGFHPTLYWKSFHWLIQSNALLASKNMHTQELCGYNNHAYILSTKKYTFELSIPFYRQTAYL